MSHTSTIDSVVIADEASLRATIRELQGQGIRCNLLENAKPRAYYSGQAGMEDNARFVVRLEDSRYDIGLYARKDGKGMEARCDLWGNDISKLLGVAPQKGESQQQAALGKLFQIYAVNAATRKANQQGYRVSRVSKPDGTVQLQIAV